MADDINKKITIKVESETEDARKNLTELTRALDSLLQRQKLLAEIGKDAGKSLMDFADKLKAAKSVLESTTKAIDDTSSAMNKKTKATDNNSKSIEENTRRVKASKDSLAQNKEKLDALLKDYDQLSRAQGDHSKTTKALNIEIGTLSNTISAQEKKMEESRKVFDLHKGTSDALNGSFDKLKNISGEFGPSLKEAAEGFETLKTGLAVVKTGFNSVGAAIKTTEFGWLVIVLQSVVEYLTKTTEGNKKLKGVIAAVGVVVEKVNKVFQKLGKSIIDAVTDPVQSINHLGDLIRGNIINRFKAFSIILDGIIHLDFKKMTDGAIQAFTGITKATDKIADGFSAVKNGFKDTANEMVDAYNKASSGLNTEMTKNEENLKNLKNRKQADRGNKTTQRPKNDEAPTTISAKEINIDTNLSTQPLIDVNIDLVKKQEEQIVAIKKTALQQIEDYAKKSTGKIASEALYLLTNNIKQQSETKIAGLEKDKAAELRNSNLTSAQKLAIEQKYKQQENKIKAKAFKEQQEISIAQALINGAVAITKVEAQTGVLGALAIPAIIAETAIQVASIAKQKPPAMAKGGYFQSDGKGAILPGYSTHDNTNAYLRSGEAVVVSEAMRVPWARNLISAINVGFGGRDFSVTNPGNGYAVGGIFTDGGEANRYYSQPANDQKNLANTIAYQMINNFPPVYVDVKDINNQQNILAQTINRVNL